MYKKNMDIRAIYGWHERSPRCRKVRPKRLIAIRSDRRTTLLPKVLHLDDGPVFLVAVKFRRYSLRVIRPLREGIRIVDER